MRFKLRNLVFEFRLSAFVVNIPSMFLCVRFRSLNLMQWKFCFEYDLKSGQYLTPKKVGTFILKKDLKGFLVDPGYLLGVDHLWCFSSRNLKKVRKTSEFDGNEAFCSQICLLSSLVSKFACFFRRGYICECIVNTLRNIFHCIDGCKFLSSNMDSMMLLKWKKML